MKRYKGQGGIGGRAPPGEIVGCCARARMLTVPGLHSVFCLMHIICNRRECDIIVFSDE